MQTDLFGNPLNDAPTIRLENNRMLEVLANQILDLVNRNPSLLDGDDMGTIDRRLLVSVWLDNGLRELIPDVEQRAKITAWMRTKAATDPDAIGRARRLLVARDLIRVSKAAIIAAESHRERIAKSVKS
jgi:hypothetical protein